MTSRFTCRNLAEYRGRMVSMPELAQITGISERTLQLRFSLGKRGKELVAPSRATPVPDDFVEAAPAGESRRSRELAKRDRLKAELMALRRVRFA